MHCTTVQLQYNYFQLLFFGAGGLTNKAGPYTHRVSASADVIEGLS